MDKYINNGDINITGFNPVIFAHEFWGKKILNLCSWFFHMFMVFSKQF